MASCQEEIMGELADIVKQNFANMNIEQEKHIPENMPYTIFVPFFEYLNQNRRFMKAISKGDLTFYMNIKEFHVEHTVC